MNSSPQPPPSGLALALVGLLLLVGGSILPLRWYLQARKPLNPLVATLALTQPVTTVHLPIHVAEAGSYTFNLAVDDHPALPTGNPDQLGCLLGVLQDAKDTLFHCNRFGQPLTLDWTVRDAAGHDLGHGHHPPGPGSGTFDNEDRRRESGTFAAIDLPAGEFALELTSLSLPPELLPVHPSIDVIFANEHYDYYKDWGDLFKALGSGALALIGLVLALFGINRAAAAHRSPAKTS